MDTEPNERKTKNIFDQILQLFARKKKKFIARIAFVLLLLFKNNLTYLELEYRERKGKNKKRNYFTTNKRSEIKLKFRIKNSF